MDILEQVEIAFRTHISYHIAHKYGPLGYYEAGHFNSLDYHNSFLNEFDREIKRSHEIFVRHHNVKYHGQLPVWVAIEVLSFGSLSKLYSNMNNEDKNSIAKTNYKVPAVYLESWLKCFSYIRNICAHYGRLYNRPLTSKPRLNKKSLEMGIISDRIFAHIYVLKELIQGDEWKLFVTKLEALITEYNNVVELDKIGFPEDWEAILISRH